MSKMASNWPTDPKREKELQQLLNFEPGNCLRVLVSIEKEQGVKQSFSNTQKRANLLGAILQVATVLY